MNMDWMGMRQEGHLDTMANERGRHPGNGGRMDPQQRNYNPEQGERMPPSGMGMSMDWMGMRQEGHLDTMTNERGRHPGNGGRMDPQQRNYNPEQGKRMPPSGMGMSMDW